MAKTPQFNPEDASTYTVSQWEMGEVPDQLTAERLLGYKSLILGTGKMITSDTYWEIPPGTDDQHKDGKRSTGHICYAVAYRPGTGEETGLPKDVLWSD